MITSGKSLGRKNKTVLEKSNISMVATGIPKLDDALSGGFKTYSTVLLSAQPGVENVEFALQTLFNRLKAGDKGLYLVNNKSPDAIRALASEYGWDIQGYNEEGTFEFFDAYSALLSTKAGAKYYCENPSDAKSLNVKLPEALAELQDHHTLLVFDALSTLLDSAKSPKEILANLKNLIANARRHRATSVFLFTEWPYPDGFVRKVKELFDCVIELKSIERKVMVQKYYSVAKASWAFQKKDVPFKIIRPGGVVVFIPKILVTGPYHAGKTSFIHSASTRAVSVNRLGTTVALDHGHVDYKGIEADLFGTPGQERFDPILEMLGSEALGIVIVVDSTKPSDFKRAKEMVELSNANDLPVIVVANKANLPKALPVEEIRKLMRLPENVPIIPTEAEDLKKIKTGEPCTLKKEDVQKVLEKLFEVVV
ncbi:MAG TPA: ATPase domain-containing protein [Candidatus Nanoarchaeia archaeon]|nr:ATPase domain-containing protein [Candidatus Nanoarchaeia archaeon]